VETLVRRGRLCGTLRGKLPPGRLAGPYGGCVAPVLLCLGTVSWMPGNGPSAPELTGVRLWQAPAQVSMASIKRPPLIKDKEVLHVPNSVARRARRRFARIWFKMHGGTGGHECSAQVGLVRIACNWHMDHEA
jgi:hypothetical protein